jgi:hypothetical protein
VTAITFWSFFKEKGHQTSGGLKWLRKENTASTQCKARLTIPTTGSQSASLIDVKSEAQLPIDLVRELLSG